MTEDSELDDLNIHGDRVCSNVDVIFLRRRPDSGHRVQSLFQCSSLALITSKTKLHSLKILTETKCE